MLNIDINGLGKNWNIFFQTNNLEDFFWKDLYENFTKLWLVFDLIKWIEIYFSQTWEDSYIKFYSSNKDYTFKLSDTQDKTLEKILEQILDEIRIKIENYYLINKIPINKEQIHKFKFFVQAFYMVRRIYVDILEKIKYENNKINIPNSLHKIKLDEKYIKYYTNI